MELELPDPALVLLIGIAGCGKSTFANHHFDSTEVLSSDGFRAMVADDPDDQDATRDAFSVLRLVLDRRLKRRRLSVVDATNLDLRARKPYLGIANRYEVPSVAMVLDLPFEICLDRDLHRVDRTVGVDVLRRQQRDLERSRAQLDDEGYVAIHHLRETGIVNHVTIVRRPGATVRP